MLASTQGNPSNKFSALKVGGSWHHHPFDVRQVFRYYSKLSSKVHWDMPILDGVDNIFQEEETFKVIKKEQVRGQMDSMLSFFKAFWGC